MKKYILISFFILLSIKNYSQTYIPPSEVICSVPILYDNSTSSSSRVIFPPMPGSVEVTFDLGRVRNISKIETLSSMSNSYPTNYLTVYVSASNLGPWQQVSNTSLSVYQTPIQIGTNNINKTFRYAKVLCQTNEAGGNYYLLDFKFYEVPTINSSNINPLINGSCTTLTASASGETYLWSTGETTQSISVCNTGTYSCTVTNTAFVGNQDHTASINIAKLGTQDNLPGPNGEVYSIYKNGNTIYMGGDFNSFGPITGSGALIDNGTGIANTALPRVDGTINSSVSDGNGGWYIGGAFTRVGNYQINNLAHIKSDNTVDLNFKPEPNNAVYTLLLDGSGTSLYAGGAFTTLKTLANNYLSKIDAVTGEPIFWNANVNGVVRSIQFYADQIIVGGSFTSLGGAARTNLGAVDTTFVQATTWAPNPNNIVYKVYVSGTKLYVGGDFTTISGVSKSRGAGYTLPAFTTDGYDMGANGRIHDFVVNNSVLYASGLFTIIGGANRNYIVGLSPLNAVANTFNPAPDGVVNTMAVSGGNLIVGGSFSNIGAAVRSRIAALSFANGTATSWNPNISGIKGTTFNVNTLATVGNNIYAGGIFYSVGGAVRNNVAAIDATTGLLSSWDANANNIVRAVYADNNYVYLGGDFTTVNGTILKNRIAQINVSNGLPTGWNPNADGSVNALALNGTTLYTGGAFANIGGAARSKMAALNTSTGAATAFSPTANGNVNSIVISGDALYIGGAFTTIGGQTRNRVASYTISTGALSTLDPNVDNIVNAVAVTNNKLYIGGTFANVSSAPRVNFAEYDIATNLITTTNSGIATTSGLNALFAVNDAVYSGGGYQLSNQGNPINNSSVIKTSDASIGYWQPQPDDIIRTIFVSSDKVYLGGRFKNILSRYQPYFASTDVYISSGLAPTIISLSSNNLCVGETLTVTGTGFMGVSSVTVGGLNVNYNLVSDTSLTIVMNSALSGTVVITNPIGLVSSASSISVNNVATPTGTSPQNLIQGQTLANIQVTGTGIVWYASSIDAKNHINPLPNTTLLVNGTTYYANQTVNGCTSGNSLTVNVAVNLGTNTFENGNFKFYPNPVENVFNFEFDKNITSLCLVNMSGQVVIKKKLKQTSGQVDISSLPSGSYILKLTSENGESAVKLMKK